jgi:DNA/RNA-binding domain of Phe-tRNA-synthetase-like protein
MQISIAEVAENFPSFRVAVVLADGLTIAAERPAALDALIREREHAAHSRWAGTELSQIPGVSVWRAAYKRFGIKQTRYRSAIERLMKNVLAGRDLARINAFVDLYNAVSLTHVLPSGADDVDKVTPPLAFRYAREGDSFVDMADVAGRQDAAEPEAPRPGEVVYADATKVLCRRWNWRQDARSIITLDTTRAIVTLQSNGWGEVGAAATELAGLIREFCCARCCFVLLDADRQNANIEWATVG